MPTVRLLSRVIAIAIVVAFVLFLLFALVVFFSFVYPVCPSESGRMSTDKRARTTGTTVRLQDDVIGYPSNVGNTVLMSACRQNSRGANRWATSRSHIKSRVGSWRCSCACAPPLQIFASADDLRTCSFVLRLSSLMRQVSSIGWLLVVQTALGGACD